MVVKKVVDDFFDFEAIGLENPASNFLEFLFDKLGGFLESI